MKEIIYNYDYLKDEDINEVVIRTKALIINSKNIILEMRIIYINSQEVI